METSEENLILQRATANRAWHDFQNWPTRQKAMVIGFSIVAVVLIITIIAFASSTSSEAELPIIVPTTTRPMPTTKTPDLPTDPTTTTTFIPITKKPIPVNYQNLSAISVLMNMGLDPKFEEIPCLSISKHPNVFKISVTVQGHSWTGEADTKKTAKAIAARNACYNMFKLTWPDVLPPASHPCTTIST